MERKIQIWSLDFKETSLGKRKDSRLTIKISKSRSILMRVCMISKMKMLMHQTILKYIGSTIESMLKTDQLICRNDYKIVIIVFNIFMNEVKRQGYI